MNQALIQNTQHDVNDHQRRKNEQRLLALRLLRGAGCALKTAAHIVGQANFSFRLFDRILALLQGCAFCQVV